MLLTVMNYKKFVRQFQILQKNNLKIQILKLLKSQKNIKELNDSLFKNYWNKTKYTWLKNKEI